MRRTGSSEVDWHTDPITWWPPAYTIGKSPMKSIVIEPRVGGRWFEVGEDGSECQWGDVLIWDPPHRLALAWPINLDWQFDRSLLTEVAVEFTDVGGGEQKSILLTPSSKILVTERPRRSGYSTAGARTSTAMPPIWNNPRAETLSEDKRPS